MDLQAAPSFQEMDLMDVIYAHFRKGISPSNSTQLYLLMYCAESQDFRTHTLLKRALDKGLTVSEFSKLNLDRQDAAMRLWIYSMAFRVFKEEAYADHARRLFSFLGENEGLHSGSFNEAFTGFALLMAHRYAGVSHAKDGTEALFLQLTKAYRENNRVYSLRESAALLLLGTAVAEERFEKPDFLFELLTSTEALLKAAYPATVFDEGVPSDISLAELAVYRAQVLLDKKNTGAAPPLYLAPLQFDFHNAFVFLKTRANHELHLKEKLDWDHLPVNSLITPGTMYLDCYNKMCKMFRTKEDLLTFFASKTSPQ